MITNRIAFSLLGLALLAACGERGARTPPEQVGVATPAETTSTATAMPGAPTDAEIAAIVLAANSADSTAGVLAESKATDPRVKEFGRRMVTDHGAVNRQAVALAQRIGLTPQPDSTSRMIETDAAQNLQTLQGLSGAAFDRAYIDHEVTMHEQVIQMLDQTLLPSAQNPELKALLEQGRPIFIGHLEMAQQIQSSLR